MNLSICTIGELQNLCRSGVEEAYAELGKKVVGFDFCLSNNNYCKHEYELHELHLALDNEIPPECPRCGLWLTDV